MEHAMMIKLSIMLLMFFVGLFFGRKTHQHEIKIILASFVVFCVVVVILGVGVSV